MPPMNVSGMEMTSATRTGHDEENESAPDPVGPVSAVNEGRQDCQNSRHGDYDRGVVTGERCDEVLRLCLPAGSVLHQVDDLRGRGLSERLRRFDRQDAVLIHAPGQDGVSGTHRARDGFPGQGARIHHGVTFKYNAVQRDFFAGLHDDGLPDGNGFRGDFDAFAVPQDRRGIRAQVHQLGNGTRGTSDCQSLEKLSDLIEQHHGNRLRIFPDDERADRGHAHQEMFIEDASPQDVDKRPPHDVAAQNEVRDDEKHNLNIQWRFQKNGTGDPDAEDDSPDDQTEDQNPAFIGGFRFAGGFVLIRVQFGHFHIRLVFVDNPRYFHQQEFRRGIGFYRERLLHQVDGRSSDSVQFARVFFDLRGTVRA